MELKDPEDFFCLKTERMVLIFLLSVALSIKTTLWTSYWIKVLFSLILDLILELEVIIVVSIFRKHCWIFQSNKTIISFTCCHPGFHLMWSKNVNKSNNWLQIPFLYQTNTSKTKPYSLPLTFPVPLMVSVAATSMVYLRPQILA